MANEVREIRFDFAANVGDMVRGTEQVAQGMQQASGEMSLAQQAMGALGGAAKGAALEAAAMAIDWAVASTDIAVAATKTGKTFDATFGPAAKDLDYAIQELAGHMGLAEYEAQGLLTQAGLLGQSMGMGASESAKFSEQMLMLAGDMAAFNPEAGSASDAMEAILKASNGATKGMAEWGVSLKAGEVNAMALSMTGKVLASDLTQQEKAMATLALITEKTANQQGTLNEKMADGSTGFKNATSDIDDMQVKVGEALMPVRKLAIEGIKILADVLISLAPALTAIGELLSALFKIIEPLLPIVSALAQLFSGALSTAIRGLMTLLTPLLNMVEKVSKALGSAASAVSNFFGKSKMLSGIKFPSFHSGGVVPGARGNPTPVMAQGGEQIGSPQSMSQGGGGTTIINNIYIDSTLANPLETGRAVADVLAQYSQATGPINITTTGG